MPLLPKRLLLIDVETTGLDPQRDSIVQIASCVLEKDDLHEERHFESLVRPDTTMTESARDVHGLSDAQLESAPQLAEVIERFSRYAPTDAILCGHNVGFDASFLRSAYQRLNREYPFDYHTVDIWSLAFFILGAEGLSTGPFNLNQLCALYGIPRGRHHSALEDVRASAMVLRYLSAGLPKKDLASSGQLKLFSAP